ncbi:MAG: hypothetical protein ABI873_18030 [Marmoricola sp.]
MPLLIAVLGGGLVGCGSDPARDVDSGQGRASSGSPEPDSTSMPPWPAPSDVPARVADAGLALGAMGMAEHYHPELRIIVNGTDVPVPANIGVDPDTGAMSAVHTHERDGTVHIEASTAGERFTLGQVFTEWGVTLTRTQIGGVKAKPGQQMRVTSNGVPVAGDPKDLRLAPDQKIVLRLP